MDELKIEKRDSLLDDKCRRRKESTAKIGIAMIGRVSFERHLCKGDSEVFVTALAEIDEIVDEGRKLEQEEELEMSRARNGR